MKKILILLSISIFLTLLLVIGLVLYLSINGNDLEAALGLSPNRDLDAESQLQGAPGRVTSQALDIYTPIPQHVYHEPKVMLEGKARAKYVIAFINRDKEILLKTDADGRFKSEIELKPGANQIYVYAQDIENGDLFKEVISGYYPELKGNTNNQFAFMGEIMQSSPTSLEIAFGKDRFVMAPTSSTKIIKGDKPSSLDKLEITERAGIIAIQEPDGKFKAIMIQTDLYPYFLFGSLLENSGTQGQIERKRTGGPKAKVNNTIQTKVYTLRDDQSLISSQFKDIPLKSKVIASGYLAPKEDRSNYFLYSLIKLPD
jgi:hypothetical protein